MSSKAATTTDMRIIPSYLMNAEGLLTIYMMLSQVGCPAVRRLSYLRCRRCRLACRFNSCYLLCFALVVGMIVCMRYHELIVFEGAVIVNRRNHCVDF